MRKIVLCFLLLIPLTAFASQRTKTDISSPQALSIGSCTPAICHTLPAMQAGFIANTSPLMIALERVATVASNDAAVSYQRLERDNSGENRE